MDESLNELLIADESKSASMNDLYHTFLLSIEQLSLCR